MLFDFDNGYHLAYDCQRKLGRVAFTDDIRRFREDQQLGPDALSEDFDLDRFDKILDERRAAIKSTLMNQQLLAGIGNVYSNEILFQSRIHPATKVRDLDRASRRTLLRTTRQVLQTAIDCQVDAEQFPDHWLLRNSNENCPRCGSRVETSKISGRTAHFCPRCQQLRSP